MVKCMLGRRKLNYGHPTKLVFITPRVDEVVLGSRNHTGPESRNFDTLNEVISLGEMASFLKERLLGHHLLTTRGRLLRPEGHWDADDGFIPHYDKYPNMEKSVYTCNLIENRSLLEMLQQDLQSPHAVSDYHHRVLLEPRSTARDACGLPLLYAVAFKGDLVVCTQSADSYQLEDVLGNLGWVHPGESRHVA